MSDLVDKIFDEHIRLPGYPQFICTRGFAYRFFRDQVGMDTKQQGPGSIHALVHTAPQVRLPLDDPMEAAARLSQVAALLKRDLVGGQP